MTSLPTETVWFSILETKEGSEFAAPPLPPTPLDLAVNEAVASDSSG